VTQAVLALSNAPLLVLRSGAAPKKNSLKLGIALDGSKYGVAAVRFVVKHRAHFGAAPTLTRIHVVPDLLKLVVPGLFGDAPVPGFKPEQVTEMQRAAFERAMAPGENCCEAARFMSPQHSSAAATRAMRSRLAIDGARVGRHARRSEVSQCVARHT